MQQPKTSRLNGYTYSVKFLCVVPARKNKAVSYLRHFSVFCIFLRI